MTRADHLRDLLDVDTCLLARIATAVADGLPADELRVLDALANLNTARRLIGLKMVPFVRVGATVEGSTQPGAKEHTR